MNNAVNCMLAWDIDAFRFPEVWMKFTKDNYLSVVADSNNINFDTPNHRNMYDERRELTMEI